MTDFGAFSTQFLILASKSFFVNYHSIVFFSNRGRRLKFLQRVFTSYFQKKTTTEMFVFFCPLIKQRAFFILSDVDSDK